MDTTADAAVSVRQSGDSVKLTVAMPYYGHPASLLLQIDTFANYPKHLRDKLKIVIIDDGSPPGLQAKAYIYLRRRSSSNSGNRGNNSDGKSIVNDNGNNTNDISDLLDLRLFYIATNIDFNMAGAKNLACHVCETSKILLLDLDVTVPEESMTKILDLEIRSSLSLAKGSGSCPTYTKHHFIGPIGIRFTLECHYRMSVRILKLAVVTRTSLVVTDLKMRTFILVGGSIHLATSESMQRFIFDTQVTIGPIKKFTDAVPGYCGLNFKSYNAETQRPTCSYHRKSQKGAVCCSGKRQRGNGGVTYIFVSSEGTI
mmetsp:Transcript_51031/g.123057  ORF Transcript_51031/g.123057 Transcript_51031/m.123057 type:complete len:314 (-) Transcript_51031:3369-4310(-)